MTIGTNIVPAISQSMNHSREPDPHSANLWFIVEQVRNGRSVIIVDDCGSSTRGFLLVAGQFATPGAITMMAAKARGLVCLALTQVRIAALGLDVCRAVSSSSHADNWFPSIEAREGVSTGISAQDRARTTAVAIDWASGPEHIVTPGHLFPIAANEGGVLIKAGRAEAAIAIAALAGLNPSAVICDILNEEGELADEIELSSFAEVERLGTIRMSEIVAHEGRTQRLVFRASQLEQVPLWGGNWRIITYRNRVTGVESLAFIQGEPRGAGAVPVKLHTMALLADAFGEPGERSGLIERAMQVISKRGVGVLVLINRACGSHMSSLMRERAEKGISTSYNLPDISDYSDCVQILHELGISEAILVDGCEQDFFALNRFGLATGQGGV